MEGRLSTPYLTAAASGVGKCSVSNGGCWSMKDPHSSTVFTACREGVDHCVCPPGFRGDGITCQGECLGPRFEAPVFLPEAPLARSADVFELARS